MGSAGHGGSERPPRLEEEVLLGGPSSVCLAQGRRLSVKMDYFTFARFAASFPLKTGFPGWISEGLFPLLHGDSAPRCDQKRLSHHRLRQVWEKFAKRSKRLTIESLESGPFID